MRWAVYIVCVLAAAAFDASFGSVLSIGPVRGQLLPSVVVFVLLSAPRRIGVRAAMAAGLAADLFAPVVLASEQALVVPGPRVLAFALGALAVLPLRSLLYRQNPLSSGVAVLVFSLFAAIGFVFIWSMRSLLFDGGAPWWPGSGAGEIGLRIFGALGDALVALPAIWLLGKTRDAWGFAASSRVAPGIARQGT